MAQKSVIIIGGGCTGAATAHDLALRGLDVTLIERGELASGTTGRCTCMIHSGARYVVKDQESARECIEENEILKVILPPYTVEDNEGVFISLTQDDPAYIDQWYQGCQECGIEAVPLSLDELHRLEPNVTRDIKAAAIIPDAVIEPMRFTMAFAATAKVNGVRFLYYTEVKEFLTEQDRVTGVRVQDRVTGQFYDVKADLVINATGPWAGEVAAMVGVDIPLSLSPGIHITMHKRLAQRVINRMHPPSSGDVTVPHRNGTVIGTTSWTVDNCDHLPVPESHIQQMLKTGQELIPALANYPIYSVNAATRPLLATEGASERDLSRTFKTLDHAERDNLEGLVTITGGKLVTARIMAEAVSDMACRKLGVEAACQTRTYPLVSFRRYFTN